MDEPELPAELPQEPLPETVTPGTETEKEPVKRKQVKIKRFNKRLSLIVSILIKLGGVFLVVFVFIVLYQELKFKGYSLREVIMPEQYEKNGYTSVAVATKIQNEIGSIQHRVNDSDFLRKGIDNSDYNFDTRNSEFEVNMIGIGLPIRSMISFIGNVFGIKPSKDIKVHLFTSDNQAFMAIYIDNELPKKFYSTINPDNADGVIDDLVVKAAHHILTLSNPEMLAIYWDFTFHDPEEIIELCAYAIRTSKDTTRNKMSYVTWGHALENTSHHDEAIDTYKKALAIDPEYLDAYLGMALSQRTLNQYKDLKQTVTKLMELSEEKLQADELYAPSLVYYNGLMEYYLGTGQLDSAQYWHSKMKGILNKIKDGWFIREYYGYPSGDLSVVVRASGDSVEANRMLLEGLQQVWSLSSMRPRIRTDITNALSYNLSEAGLYDTALFFVQKAIRLDSTDGYIYSTLAEIYAYKGNADKFYESLEKGLKYGYPPGYVDDSLIPYSYHRGKRLDELVRKYSKQGAEATKF